MDYKKIIKSRTLRQKILELLQFIPDKPMISLQYRIKTGRKLNWQNPKRFTEKLQHYKLYYKNPLMIQCVDKYDVREYVKSKGLGHLLNECYGVYDGVDDIDFDKLPNQFVAKDTLGGGGNDVVICMDKSTHDLDGLKETMRGWIARKLVKSGGREWPYYSGKKHRILIEPYIEVDSALGLVDYKFFVMNQKIAFMYVMSNRKFGIGAELVIMDAEFNRLPVIRTDEVTPSQSPVMPPNFDCMKEIAVTLAGDFPEVRVDLYNVHGKIVFGEMTFWDGSGYMKFEPDGFDEEIGARFDINS